MPTIRNHALELTVADDGAAALRNLGSAKLPVPVHADWYAVPMTALVYHDSMIHDWWEVHNYNNPNHRNQFGSASVRFPQGGGLRG
jgi:hypothetical protein